MGEIAYFFNEKNMNEINLKVLKKNEIDLKKLKKKFFFFEIFPSKKTM